MSPLRALICVAIVCVTMVATFAAPAVCGPGTDDAFWSSPFTGPGPNQFTDDIVLHNGMYYLGGNFSLIGGLTVNYIAAWGGGDTFERLGSGVGTSAMGLVHTIAIKEGSVYAGGMFDQVGTWPAGNIARYDAATGYWVPLGAGTNRAVRRIRVGADGDIYVAGEFNEADKVVARAVARYDGLSWHGLGAGLELRNDPRSGGRAMALAPAGNGMYVGGYFDHADGVPASNVAYWNGSQFLPLGDGVNGMVNTMTYHAGQLYVGGSFSSAGGRVVGGIARWDGSKWHALGGGVSGAGGGYVRTIHMAGKWVYAGGKFSLAGGNPASNIAVYDGSAWHALGAGVSDEVKIITSVGDRLYVGGNFNSAGTEAIPYVAAWDKNVITFDALRALRSGDKAEIIWAITSHIPVTTVRLHRRAAGADETTLIAEITDPSVTQYTDDGVAPTGEYRYEISVIRVNGTERHSAPVTLAAMPVTMALHQNFPNPFNPSTTVAFTAPGGTPMRLVVVGADGQVVATLFDGTPAAGMTSVPWDGTNDRGQRVSSGVYFSRLEMSGEVQSRKMVLIK